MHPAYVKRKPGRIAAIAKGNCTNHYSRPAKPGHRNCQECLDKSKKYYETKKATGRCTQCLGENDRASEGVSSCSNCRSYRQDYGIEKRLGVTREDYWFLFMLQSGVCAICKQPGKNDRHPLHTDHCHKTNLVRGLLCARCNHSIGKFEDSPSLLRKAASYLDQVIAAPISLSVTPRLRGKNWKGKRICGSCKNPGHARNRCPG